MPRSTPPRKAYRPVGVRLDAHGLAIDLATVLSAQQQADLLDPARAALEQMRLGRGGWEAWRALADVSNVAEALAEGGIAGNLADKVHAAQEALAAVAGRVNAGRSWTLRGLELGALDDLVWLHEVQLQHATQGETTAAIERVKRRVKGVLSGSASPSATVIVGALQ
jgi:hypothetical protein